MNLSSSPVLLGVAAIFCESALAQPMPSGVSLAAIRADEQERDKRLGPGSMVGDLGAGYGYYAARFSPVLGPNGRVFAEEIE